MLIQYWINLCNICMLWNVLKYYSKDKIIMNQVLHEMCSSEKYPSHPPHPRPLVQENKFIKIIKIIKFIKFIKFIKSLKLNWNFQWVGVFEKKSILWKEGERDILWNCTLFYSIISVAFGDMRFQYMWIGCLQGVENSRNSQSTSIIGYGFLPEKDAKINAMWLGKFTTLSRSTLGKLFTQQEKYSLHGKVWQYISYQTFQFWLIEKALTF